MSDDDEFDLPTQESIHTDLRALFRGAVRVALETVLEDEIRNLVGAGRYQRPNMTAFSKEKGTSSWHIQTLGASGCRSVYRPRVAQTTVFVQIEPFFGYVPVGCHSNVFRFRRTPPDSAGE